MALLCKRGVQLAANLSKSSSSSTSISRSLGQSSNVKRVVNNNTLDRGGRWAFGAVRGYSDASSNSFLSHQDPIQKKMQQHELEIAKLRTEIERMNQQFETKNLRNKVSSSEELRSESDKVIVEDNTAKTIDDDEEKIIGNIRQLEQKLDGVRARLNTTTVRIVLVNTCALLFLWLAHSN